MGRLTKHLMFIFLGGLLVDIVQWRIKVGSLPKDFIRRR